MLIPLHIGGGWGIFHISVHLNKIFIIYGPSTGYDHTKWDEIIQQITHFRFKIKIVPNCYSLKKKVFFFPKGFLSKPFKKILLKHSALANYSLDILFNENMSKLASDDISYNIFAKPRLHKPNNH